MQSDFCCGWDLATTRPLTRIYAANDTTLGTKTCGKNANTSLMKTQ
jgi:hypothetical protein